MAKKSKLTPTRVSIKLASGKTTTGIRHKNLVPAPSALTPPAGPRTYEELRARQAAKIAAKGEPPEFNPRTGLNAAGWTRDGWHHWTRNRRHYYQRTDSDGLDRDGYATWEKPFDDFGFTPHGFDENNFDRDGVHRDTGTPFDPEGRDRHGFYQESPLVHHPVPERNADGFGRDGVHLTTGTEFNAHGFNWEHMHQTTGTPYCPRGFGHHGVTRDGAFVDADGRDFRGLDKSGRDLAGNHFMTGTPLNPRGFDAAGVHAETGTRLDAYGTE